MQFNDTTSRTGLIQECEGLLGMETKTISGNTTLLKDFTRRINNRYSQVDYLIFESHGGWKYDDLNKTDLPIATADLVNDQDNYEIPDEALNVERVEVKDTNGEWIKLAPFRKELEETALDELYSESGTPEYYELVGRSVILRPTPSTNNMGVDSALKIYFSRSSTSFTDTNTSLEPGFANPFHRMLAIGASLDYCLSYDIFDKANQLRSEWNEYVRGLKTHYTSRFKELRPRIIPYEQSSI